MKRAAEPFHGDYTSSVAATPACARRHALICSAQGVRQGEAGCGGGGSEEDHLVTGSVSFVLVITEHFCGGQAACGQESVLLLGSGIRVQLHAQSHTCRYKITQDDKSGSKHPRQDERLRGNC